MSLTRNRHSLVENFGIKPESFSRHAADELFAPHRASEQWKQPTGRIDSARAAEILGFQEHDMPVLVHHALLKPLGNPAKNARKYFAAVDVLALSLDPRWLAKATQTVYDHWETKNANREREESQQPQT
jgi:hypothetical protein